ncbi:MAG: hypothetical protein LBT40_02060 [Deltaproteobacteria bacterium]|jgi:hypothetical protein|nr:hypothetical protein [Deltaproteobacteria bacterium]
MKRFLAAAACGLMALALMAGAASAQFDLRKPQDHHKFLENGAYRSAYETCEAVLAQTLAAVTGDQRPTAETAQYAYPSTAGREEWAQAYRTLTVAYAEAMGDKLPLNADAPLQGYYSYLGDPDTGQGPEGGMTVVMVGDGPMYGAVIETVTDDGYTCEASSAGMLAVEGKLTFHPDDMYEQENGVVVAIFNGNRAEVGPQSAFGMNCGMRGVAAGTYERK